MNFSILKLLKLSNFLILKFLLSPRSYSIDLDQETNKRYYATILYDRVRLPKCE